MVYRSKQKNQIVNDDIESPLCSRGMPGSCGVTEERESGTVLEEILSEMSFEGWVGQVKEEGNISRKWQHQTEKRQGTGTDGAERILERK